MPIVDWSKQILIAELTDDPGFTEDLDDLLRRLERRAGHMPHVVADLKDVEKINSTNLAQLLRLRGKLQRHRRRLRLCAVGAGVWSVILMAELDAAFEFNEDVSTSLAALQTGQ